MTPQEQQLIAGLIDRVQKTQLTEKDPDAEQMLRQGLGTSPNALYILAQTVLVQQFALEQARHQLADAQAQSQAHTQEPRRATSFLGSLFGHSDPAPPPPSQQGYQPVPGYSQAPPPSQAGYPQQPPPSFQTMAAPPGGGGFMRSALQTATGVAAGALAFEGVESLLHGFGGGGGFGGGQGLGGFGSGGRPEEIVNNYYGDSGSRDASGLSPDIEDRRSDFNDNSVNSDDLPADDQQLADDGSNDLSNLDDDSSTFDDGGSGDAFDSGDLGSGGDDSSFS